MGSGPTPITGAVFVLVKTKVSPKVSHLPDPQHFSPAFSLPVLKNAQFLSRYNNPYHIPVTDKNIILAYYETSYP